MRYIYILIFLLLSINAFPSEATTNVSTNQISITVNIQTNEIVFKLRNKLYNHLNKNELKDPHSILQILLGIQDISGKKNAPAEALWAIYFKLQKYKAILNHIKQCSSFIFEHDILHHSQYFSTMLLKYNQLSIYQKPLAFYNLEKQVVSRILE